jgi:glycosyltransferase involved in cell wall biosynthesis
VRILHISTRLILGGSQENTVLSCEGQARLGHDVHLAFGPIFGPEGSLLDRVRGFRTPAGAGITVHEIQNLVREISPWRDRRGVRELETLIDTLRPDVVHTHSSKAGILGREAAWRVRERTRRTIAIVHTVHGPPFMPVEGSPWARARTRLLNHVYTLAERRAATRCDVIVSVADAMTREFLSRGIGRPDQFVTVRSGMETEAFLVPRPGESREDSRRALGIPPDAFVVGTIARLAQHKGHDDLLLALADLLRAHPLWTLLWVGDGWWRERLVARAGGLGLSVRELDRPGVSPASARLIITGLVPPQRIPPLLRAMDVLAHPSSREGLPRTVPQALLAGVCPVAYDADGTREACREMQTGRLVPVGDHAALREAIAWCAANPADRQALAQRGREDCRESFSVESMVTGLEQVYARALDGRRSARPRDRA